MARARASTIVWASSTSRRSATETKSVQQKKNRRTMSYEGKTAKRVAEITAKKAPHLVAIARINAEVEQLRVQLSLKKQEREIMEKVLGVVHSRERGNSGWREKQGSLKLLDGLRTVEMRGLWRCLVVTRLRDKYRWEEL